MAQRSLDLIEAMREIAKAMQPITGRGIGYKLFTRGLIPSMSTNDMQKVYRLLRIAREQGDIPWEWIVDETRAIERVSTWADPAEYAERVARSYRRDFWNQQPHRVQVWSRERHRARRARTRCSITMASASFRFTALAAPQQHMTLPRMTTAAR